MDENDKPEEVAQVFVVPPTETVAPPPTETVALGPAPAAAVKPERPISKTVAQVRSANLAKAREQSRINAAARKLLAAQVPAVVEEKASARPNGAAPPGDRPKPVATRQRHVLRPIEEYPADEALNEKFHIPRSQWPTGYALQWEAYQVYNQPQNERQAVAMRVGWEPVYPEDFDHKFSYKVPYGWQGPIAIDGLMLMARSMEWDKFARARDKRQAENVINIRVRQLARGELEKVTLDTQHKHLSKTNFVNASVDQVGVSGEQTGEMK